MTTDAFSAMDALITRLRRAGLAGATDGGQAMAALRLGAESYAFLTWQGEAPAGALPEVRRLADKRDAPSLALLLTPDANAALLLPGVYALRAANAVRKLRAELDDMAQIVGLSARTAKDDSEPELRRCLRRRSACFVRGAGMLLTGRSAGEAVTAAILLEKAAMTHLLSARLGGARRVPLFAALLMRAIYRTRYSKINLSAEASGAAEAAQTRAYSERERALREDVVAYGKKLVEQGLVQGTWGNLSARLDEASMLVTPSGLDYRLLTSDDIVRVAFDTLAYDGSRKPTSESRLHRDIYAARPEVGAIIHTHAAHCGVFGAARAALPACDGGVRCAPHALPSTKPLSRHALAALEGQNACLLANHGMICCGEELAEAFAGCEALERAAAERLNATGTER